MKQFYVLLFMIILGFNYHTSTAQITDNPIDKLVEKIYQNDLLSTRFLRNFAFIKTNTFKKKAMLDMDKSIAMFDNNLSYIILHLPDNNKVKDDFLKLQNFWNIYRLDVTNYESEKYKSLSNKTIKFQQLINQLKKDVINKHNSYSRNKKAITIIDLAVKNNNNIDKLIISNLFKSGLNQPEVIKPMNFTSNDLKRNLKKIKKNKALKGKADDLILDLNNSVDAINSLLEKDKYKPKTMHAYVNFYSKKTFKLLEMIMNTINEHYK